MHNRHIRSTNPILIPTGALAPSSNVWKLHASLMNFWDSQVSKMGLWSNLLPDWNMWMPGGHLARETGKGTVSHLGKSFNENQAFLPGQSECLKSNTKHNCHASCSSLDDISHWSGKRPYGCLKLGTTATLAARKRNCSFHSTSQLNVGNYGWNVGRCDRTAK